MLRERNRIVAKVRQHGAKQFAKEMINFGIECPKMFDQALALDKKNSNILWANAIAKDMKNIPVAFNIQEKGDPLPIGNQFIKCHMILDLKI